MSVTIKQYAIQNDEDFPMVSTPQPTIRHSGCSILDVSTFVSEETGEVSVCPITWGQALIHTSVLRKDKKEVKRLLRTPVKADLNRLHHGLTPLHLAVRFNNAEMVECLLRAKAQVNKQNEDGETPLFLACSSGDAVITDMLIKHGADVNLTRGMLTSPLFCAAANGHVALVKMLIKHKVDLEWTNATGIAALGIAVFNNQKEVAKTLIEAKCQVNTFDKYGRSPLFYAVEGHSNDIVEMILKNGGDQFKNAPDKSGLYALYLACSRGDFSIVQLLVAAGANVNIMCEDKTPVYVAVQKGYTKIVQCLVQNGAKLNIRCESGCTAIFAAVTHRSVNEEIVRALIQGGCDVNTINVWKNCPVQAAKLHGNRNAAKMLLDADANPFLLDVQFACLGLWANNQTKVITDTYMATCMNSLFKSRTLKRMCRAVIRDAVSKGYNYQQKIDQLYLPRSLKDFLMFKDV